MKILRNGGAMTLAVLTLTACDDATSPEPFDDTALNLDVATVAADATVSDVLDMVLVTEALGAWGPGGRQGPMGPAGPGGSVNDQLSRTHTVTFYDAAGAEMDSYDPLLTASIHVVTEMSGTRETPNWSGTVERHRDRTVSGLAGEETQRTWNGTGTNEVTRTRFGDETWEYGMSSTSTTEDVVVAVPRSENPWPLSGTITKQVTVHVEGPNGERTVERTVVITFDGTQYATLTVDGETFEVDLMARQGERPRRRGYRG